MLRTISQNALFERFLAARGWQKIQGSYQSPDANWRCLLDGEGWLLQHWHVIEAQGETLAELEREAVSLGAIAWSCPNCGEEGGEPRECYDRYFYGADADGNRGEWREDTIEGCSQCIVGGRMVR